MKKRTRKRRENSYGKMKSPYVYSSAYHAWRRARLAGNETATRAAEREHARQFMYTPQSLGRE